MQFLAWLVVCAVAAVALRRSPTAVAGITLVLWVMVPGLAAHVLTGVAATSSIGFHPASWFLVAAVVALVLTDASAFATELGRHFWYYLVLGLVAIEILVLTRMGQDTAGVVVVVDEVLVPVLLFLVVNVALTRNARAAGALRTTLLAVTSFECFFAAVQLVAGSALVFESSFLTQFWFHPATWSRWMGTTDHPLNLSLLICAATPFVAGIRRTRWVLPLLAVFGVGTLITQSRTGAIAFVIGAGYVLYRSAMPRWSKIATVLGTAVLAGFVLPATVLGSGILSRIANDTGSSDARASALDFFSAEWTRYLASGDGLTAGYRVAAQGGLITSFESSIVMYAVGVGILATAIYFGAQVALLVRNAWWQAGHRELVAMPGALLSGVVMLVIPQTYSALAAQVLAGPLLWFVLAFVSRPEVGAVPRTAPATPTDAPPASEAMVTSR